MRTPFVVAGSLASGLIVGWIGGGVGPRRELSRRDEQIASLRREIDALDRGGWRSPVPGLDRILREPERSREETSSETARAGDGRDHEGAMRYDGGVSDDPGWRVRWSDRSAQDRFEAFHQAATIQDVRRAQSFAALTEQAQLSEEERVEVEHVMQTLNDEIQVNAEELILLAMDDEAPAARDLLGITHEVTGILERAQLALEGIIGPERLEGVEPSAMEVWNYIDLSTLEPAARAALDRVR